ncbi:hypothetical protein CR162_19040 [Pseudoroseomonas rhizosphaerae]|uniref:Uncharacterized protein n=1 Tax=Teichococcus rhizosphaerae TaxID=1335062 RepID=A0A2C6ZZX4_9PROT|nr:hypothetical protein [Pseudoroseomonas rhizosphaerae]PHK93358.1 hypothetical protein CR162_19040 [Pseudoroseomonas rhizosphaerae]
MAELLREPERDRLIAYLERHLLRTVTLDGQAVPALRETHPPFPTSEWCWTADSATALEMLAQPHLHDRWRGMADGLTDFLLGMGTGHLLFSRVSPPECVVRSADPRQFLIRTRSHEFRGDLSRGVLVQSVRGGAARREIHHTGHLVEFRTGRQRHCLDVEDSIVDCGVEPRPDGVVLFHESALRVQGGLLRKTEREVGRLRYEYAIGGGDPRLLLRVTLRAAPGVVLENVRLTTALDALSAEPERPFRHLVAERNGRLQPLPVPGAELIALHQGPTRLFSLTEEAAPGAANGVHIAPLAPQALHSIKAQGLQGRLHWVLTRYLFPRLEGGAEAAIREARLLTAGTHAAGLPAYEAILADPAILSGRDAGLSADVGTALNAMATQLFFAARNAYAVPLPAERQAQMRVWYDRHLAQFFAGMEAGGEPAMGRAYLRALAFALLSLDTMLRATGEARYAALLDDGLTLLLRLQQPEEAGGAFADYGQAAYLDCHAAAMLALARLLPRRPEPAVQAALRQALAAVRVGTLDVPLEKGPHRLDTPFVRRRRNGRWDEDGGFWSFKLGLLMRALNALRLAAQGGFIVLEPAEQEHVAALSEACFAGLRGRVRDLGDTLEVLTSPVAGEGNAATQPAVLMGLMAPDEAILRLSQPAAALG